MESAPLSGVGGTENAKMFTLESQNALICKWLMCVSAVYLSIRVFAFSSSIYDSRVYVPGLD